MDHNRVSWAGTCLALGLFAMGLAVLASRSRVNVREDFEDFRDAVASPAPSPRLGATAIYESGGLSGFARPSLQTARAEAMLMSSRNRRRGLPSQ
ncbi:MAG: hypothetical protein AAB036_02435 [Elusimicrobiota bacterium]